ncbi:protein argonaute 16 isoform X2 [Cajanus cajan]|uniref:protein argonaute 16 isoform X2 n=1 Tax=Cajanus cajan TaxID=3821 RepID=UPI00098DCFC8|nr:protein argonaute 16 isoform X2 [Cajanus cajan]
MTDKVPDIEEAAEPPASFADVAKGIMTDKVPEIEEAAEPPASRQSSADVLHNLETEQMAPTKYSIISRNGIGTTGKRIPLLVNLFKVDVNAPNPDTMFFQYSVTITFEDKRAVESKGIWRKVIHRLYQMYSSELGGKRFAYDGGRALYTVGPLPLNKYEFKVLLEESFTKCSAESPGVNGSLCEKTKRSKHSFQSKTFIVEISFVAKIPLQSIALKEVESDALRVLDIVMRQRAANCGCLLVRQSFFHDDSRNFTDIGAGVTAVSGFHSSFRPTQRGLSFNMDVSTTMIIKPGPVVDFLLANQQVREPRYIDWAKAKKMLKNLRVQATHSNQKFKIYGFSEKPCIQQLFSMKVKNDNGNNEGQTVDITVYEYFAKHRGIELTSSAYLPCLDVGKPNRPIYLPLELCALVSLQRYTKVLSPMQRASLVEKSRQKPQDRIKILKNAVGNYCYDDDPVLAACGISIEKQLTLVEGRVLETPKLKVGKNDDCFPNSGRWDFNKKTLLQPSHIDFWAVVNFSARCDTSYISRELIRCGMSKGINIERPYTLIEEEPQLRKSNPVTRVERMFDLLASKLTREPNLILCVLPERKNCDIYGPWKKKCLSEIGVVTQCISPPLKITDQYLTNVLLKINSKLGGINSLLAIEHSGHLPLIKDTPTMILGMDVSHSSLGRSDIPSIAAVVGSRHWPLISRYRATVRMQASKLEMIDALFKPLENGSDDGIIRELLLDFYQSSNGRKPTQFIVFRDGVSESQFKQVLDIEINQIIKAYQHLGETNVPKFTVIVAQKNHHVKLFLANGPENVSPGTVVDTTITHPRNYDFYMCAHAGMIGTSKPVHYHVLLDEIGFSADGLQDLIYSLSYVNQRSTIATSVVAPVSYAHHAAAQMGQFFNFDDLSETSDSEGNIPIPELPRLHKNVRSSMFFC